MTDHNDAIERALEELDRIDNDTFGLKRGHWPIILRDLVAEVQEQWEREGGAVTFDRYQSMCRFAEERKRRLARIMAECYKLLACGALTPHEADLQKIAERFLAIAREEGE